MTTALLLAAGRGERLRPLTDHTPKPLISDGCEPLLDRHLRALQRAGVTRVVINLGWLGERIVQHAGNGQRFGLAIAYSPEGYPTLDTGGAIVRALPQLGDDAFWVINADIHTDYLFPNKPESWLEGADAAIGLVPNPAYRERGDFGLVDGWATNDQELTFTGIACYRPTFFAGLADGRFSVVPHLRAAVAESRVRAQVLPANWADVGTPERLASVRAGVPDA